MSTPIVYLGMTLKYEGARQGEHERGVQKKRQRKFQHLNSTVTPKMSLNIE